MSGPQAHKYRYQERCHKHFIEYFIKGRRRASTIHTRESYSHDSSNPIIFTFPHHYPPRYARANIIMSRQHLFSSDLIYIQAHEKPPPHITAPRTPRSTSEDTQAPTKTFSADFYIRYVVPEAPTWSPNASVQTGHANREPLSPSSLSSLSVCSVRNSCRPLRQC